MWVHNATSALSIFRRAVGTQYKSVFRVHELDGHVEWLLDLRRLSGSAAQVALVWWIQVIIISRVNNNFLR
jgi:hypothetical protein